jgi:hypothetical protein
MIFKEELDFALDKNISFLFFLVKINERESDILVNYYSKREQTLSC